MEKKKTFLFKLGSQIPLQKNKKTKKNKKNSAASYDMARNGTVSPGSTLFAIPFLYPTTR